MGCLMIVVVQENHEDQREMLATDKLCLALQSVIIHLIKIISLHATYVYFILPSLFVLLMVLFSKREVSQRCKAQRPVTLCWLGTSEA